MANRLDLQAKLEEFLGSRNVYFQPPESLKMEYDAIKYDFKKTFTKRANDSVYLSMNCYELILITRKPAFDKIEELMKWPYCSFDRPYKSDNLYHYAFTLYY